MSEKHIGKTVRFTLDPQNLPPLTAEQKEQLERLRNMKDEDIDLSDAPAATPDTVWTRRYPAPLRKAS